MITVLTHFLMSHLVPAAPYGAFCLEASACFWMCKVKPCLSPHPMGGLLKIQLILKAVQWGLVSICAETVWVISLQCFCAVYFPFYKLSSPLCTAPNWRLYKIYTVLLYDLYPKQLFISSAPWTWHIYRWLHKKVWIWSSGWAEKYVIFCLWGKLKLEEAEKPAVPSVFS